MANQEPNSEPSGDVITMVCLTCGNERFFDDAPPPSLTCDKCGSTVFRTFSTPTQRDEAAISGLEE